MRRGFSALSVTAAAIVVTYCASAPANKGIFFPHRDPEPAGMALKQTVVLDGHSTQIIDGCSPHLWYIGYDLLIRNAALRSDPEHALDFPVLKVGMDVSQMHTIKTTIEDLRSRVDKVCALNQYTGGNARCRGARDSLYGVLVSLADDLANARTAGEADGAIARAKTKASAINEVEACR